MWIDGDHTYEGAKADFDSFRPYLADGAITAIHDVLHEFEGSIRVFDEEILGSAHFGAAGLVGSIGWAQYWQNPDKELSEEKSKKVLRKKLSRLIPFVTDSRQLTGIRKLTYKLFRSAVPHGEVDPAEWLGQVTVKEGHDSPQHAAR